MKKINPQDSLIQKLEIYLRVKVTAYNSTVAQTDSTPFEAAWGHRVHNGMIAVSRDLEEIGLTRGLFTFEMVKRDVWLFPILEIEGREYIIKDRLNKRKRRQLDIWMEHEEDAIEWGVQYCTIKVKMCSKVDINRLCKAEEISCISSLNQSFRSI